MGLSYNIYLNSDRIFGCKHCKTHLANHDAIISRVCFSLSPSLPIVPSLPFSCLCTSSPFHYPIPIFSFLVLYIHPSARTQWPLTIVSRSQNFRGQHGKAYLFNAVVNITQAEATERNMTTGKHVVRDINCRQCKETVGWKYDKAYESSEKYKEGKYILEAELLCAVY